MIEEAIKENTSAISEQTKAILSLVDTLNKGGIKVVSVGGPADIVETLKQAQGISDQPAPEKAKAGRKPAGAKPELEVVPPAEPEVAEAVATSVEPDPLAEFEATVETKEDEYKLPEGERTDAFYQEHIFPLFKALVSKARDTAVDIVTEYGATKGSEVAPKDWDGFYADLKRALARLD